MVLNFFYMENPLSWFNETFLLSRVYDIHCMCHVMGLRTYNTRECII